jgi:hypothetical protein
MLEPVRCLDSAPKYFVDLIVEAFKKGADKETKAALTRVTGSLCPTPTPRSTMSSLGAEEDDCWGVSLWCSAPFARKGRCGRCITVEAPDERGWTHDFFMLPDEAYAPAFVAAAEEALASYLAETIRTRKSGGVAVV